MLQIAIGEQGATGNFAEFWGGGGSFVLLAASTPPVLAGVDASITSDATRGVGDQGGAGGGGGSFVAADFTRISPVAGTNPDGEGLVKVAMVQNVPEPTAISLL